MYYSLANIDPAMRSSLDAICLLAVFHTHVLDEYSMDEILKPFLEDLKTLSQV